MGRKAVSFLFYGISVVLTGLLLVAAVLCRYASSVSPGEGGFWATLALLMPTSYQPLALPMIWETLHSGIPERERSPLTSPKGMGEN